MKLVVGLGNPGPRYAYTRHNVGFRVALHFAADHGIEVDEEAFDGRLGRGWLSQGEGTLEVAVLLPLTFMNRSGDSVAAALQGLGVEDPADLLVVYDEVDLPFGRLRIRHGGGAGGHNGMRHLIERLGRQDFPRLRVGVGRPPEGTETRDHVLAEFGAEEQRALPQYVARCADAVAVAVHEGVEAAMNRFNRDPDADEC